MHAMCVLIDDTAKNGVAEVKVHGLDAMVPVYRTGPISAANRCNFDTVWRSYLVSGNLEVVAEDSLRAFKAICETMATDDCCGTALSIVAEVNTMNRPGVYAASTGGGTGADFSNPAGMYTAEGTVLGDATRVCNTTGMFSPGARLDTLREKMCGFNFGSVSALLSVPTSSTRVNLVVVKDPPNAAEIEVITDIYCHWSTTAPQHSLPQYQITASSSLMRLAIAAKLIDSSTHNYSFFSAVAVQNWITMQSAALTFMTSAALFKNNMDLRLYQGWSMSNNHEMEVFVGRVHELVSGGLVTFLPPSRLTSIQSDWAYNKIANFWSMATTSPEWSQFYPVSLLCVLQWMEKMAITPSISVVPTSYRYSDADTRVPCVIINSSNFLQVLHLFATPDVNSYGPVASTRGVIGNGAMRTTGVWFQNFGRISRYRRGERPDQSMFSYQLPSFSSSAPLIGVDNMEIQWFISNAANNMTDPKYQTASTSRIVWPDPPTLSTFLAKVADYTVSPALMGLLGYFTGGPVGAAVAAGSQIVSQAASDISAYKAEKNNRETLSNMQEMLKTAQVNQPALIHPENPTHMSTDSPHDERDHREAKAVQPANPVPASPNSAHV